MTGGVLPPLQYRLEPIVSSARNIYYGSEPYQTLTINRPDLGQYL